MTLSLPAIRLTRPSFLHNIAGKAFGAEWSETVCNLYSMLKSQEAMRQLFDRLVDRVGNMPSLPGIYPDYSAPLIATDLKDASSSWRVGACRRRRST